MKKIVALFLILVFSVGVFALVNNETEKKSTDLVFSKDAQSLMKFHNITALEYSKFLTLKKQYQGLVSENITALEYLGIFAKTKQDREKYARMFNELNRATAAKVLAFDKAVIAADRKNFGFDNVVNYYVQKKTKTKQRKKLTISINRCNKNCHSEIRRLALLAEKQPVDFYFVNATDDEIKQFAFALELSKNKVRGGLITLNHAN